MLPSGAGFLCKKWTTSVAQKLSYSRSLQYPSDIRASATRLDTVLCDMFLEGRKAEEQSVSLISQLGDLEVSPSSLC